MNRNENNVRRYGLRSSHGAIVMEVIPDSPAAHAGLRLVDEGVVA